MKYLTAEQILAIHDQLIKRFGGSFGLRDVGLLESATARPQSSFGGEDLYPIMFEKAAALLHSLLKNHPFLDDNERTALSSSGIFLKLNGYDLMNSHEEELQFALHVENENLAFEDIAAWLQKHSKKA